MGEIQMQNALREQSRQRELESIMSQLSPTASVSEQAAALHKRGYFQQAQALTQQAATLAKTRREEEDARLKALTSKLDLTGRFFSEDVKDQATYDVARQKAIAAGLGTADEIPEVFDPAIVARVRNNAMSIKDQLAARQREREVGARETSAQAAASQAATAAQKAQRDRVPMSVQEFEAFNRMTPDQQAAFTAFRASQRPTTTVTTNVSSGEKLTPLQEAIDRKFADDLIAWKSGASVSAAKNAAQIATVLDQLHEGKQLTGPMVGITPDVVLAVTNPNALDARQRVEQVAQESLRSILGAQFTQKEGEAFIARVYDPKLKPEKNASRLRALFKQIDEAAKQKQAMVDYADTHGTLRGFKGTVPTMADFYAAIGEKPEDAAKSARPRGSAPVRSAEGTTSTSKFRLIGPAPAEQ